MIVFRNCRKSTFTDECLDRISALIHSMPCSNMPHDKVVSLLIETGDLETSVADSLFPEIDSLHPLAEKLRECSLCAAALFRASWNLTVQNAETHRNFESLFEEIRPRVRGMKVNLSVMEGFAYYGLYPEMYLHAAESCMETMDLKEAVVIGIRTIGTVLSAVVSVELMQRGCKVRSYTLRPHGHPFGREPSVAPELREKMLSNESACYIIVDEGPGLSGSSLGGIAEYLSVNGIPDDRIVYFTSWQPGGDAFLSSVARTHWLRHNKCSSTFEDAWVHTGRLQQSFQSETLKDISAGMWRKNMYGSSADFPAIHPHHERRKYLFVLSDRKYILRFSGLGRYGESMFERAGKLAETGFCPVPVSFRHGFVMYPFVNGYPAEKGVFTDENVEDIASYLLILYEQYPGTLTAPYEKMIEMIRLNVREGMGEEWSHKLDRLPTISRVEYSGDIKAVDGRMFPWEFIVTQSRISKLDHTDHHSDQFFPGCQRIEWDIAGALAESGFTRRQKDAFIEKILTGTRDRRIISRLPFYMTAYCAFRLGYASVASEALKGTGDGARFALQYDYYTEILKRILNDEDRDEWFTK